MIDETGSATTWLAMPGLGLGTWNMGETSRTRAREVAALRAGLDAGITLIDTAEMYADGGAESVVGEAIANRRDGLFLVSKVLPSNAHFDGVLAACDRSRQRLAVDCIDLYLLHWPGAVPLSETLRAFEVLRSRGWIGAWGVSNFDARALRNLLDLPGGSACAVNQVYYSPGARGIEFDLLPLHREHGIATMAYCPLDQGRLAANRSLQTIAQHHGASPAQVALAWLMSRGTTPIPKSASAARARENAAAPGLQLTADDLAAIDRAFPPPTRAMPLKIV